MLTTDDLGSSLAWCAVAWERVEPDQWDLAVPPSDWTNRRTLDHLVDTMVLYSSYVATRATGRVAAPRNGDPTATPAQLIDALRSTGTVLQRVIHGLPAGGRAFHPSGLADRTGWIAMACTELLVHTFDAAAPPIDGATAEIARKVVERALPWAPEDGDGWQRLLWATGRAPLSGHDAASADWWWHSAPLEEWNGRPRRRSSPPQW